MVFSSALFLFCFLPIVLFCYYVVSLPLRNIILLCASLFFYCWGEPKFYYVMLISITFNWLLGMAITKYRMFGRVFIVFGVVLNLSLLIYYKYFNFVVNNFNDILGPVFHVNLSLHTIILPLGISFFTFHSMSYLIDIYRGESRGMKNPLDMGLYISLFPQLVAGPIIRYHDISEQIQSRTNTLARFSSGVERFVFGLGKKILLANSFGKIADLTFDLPDANLHFLSSWIGMICYSLQIYYDFSGYSDMAIGLGRMFGFELLENFDYPYIATSVRDFWRRWHLSLSAWFRDYLYIPLGGSRQSLIRTQLNLFAVFLLCGLWHGASWNFVFWGGLHGLLLVAERGRFGNFIKRLPLFFSRSYTLVFVMLAWVFFRADSFSYSLRYIVSLVKLGNGLTIDGSIALYLTNYFWLKFGVGIVLATPVATFLTTDWQQRKYPIRKNELYKMYFPPILGNMLSIYIVPIRTVCLMFVFLLSISELAISTYNPFIYFRF